MTAPCTQLLTNLGVLGSIDIHDFQMGFIPVDPDVLSLESDDVYKHMALVRPFHFSLHDQSRLTTASSKNI